jgi:Spx/MgsR family transcriptional regulator
VNRLTFYGLKNCDSCRKAQKALAAAGVPYVFVDIRADGVPPDRLVHWLKLVGPEVLINRKSTTWRGLSEGERAKADAGDAFDLLETYPTLIKRPVIETEDGAVLVGWSAENQQALGA